MRSDKAVSAFPSAPHGAVDWPEPLGAGAFGVLGDVAEALEGNSEADPVAVVWQLLAAVGCYLGQRHWCQVDEDRHHPRLWVLLVGGTASRKGLSFGVARGLLKGVDEDWAKHQIASGLASGEALIENVRDPDPDQEDAGAPDNRLVVQEPEFATLLRIGRREGSTLSGILRGFYDSGDAQIRRAKRTTKATGATVSVVGHITRPELAKEVTATDLFNGLVNRFAVVMCRRQGHHPEGGRLPEATRKRIIAELAKSVTWARKQPSGEVKRDAEAKALWASMYPSLTDRPETAYGFATSRAAAHTLRLSLLIALLDRSTTIREDHLVAAADLWRYADDSARIVFAESSGNPRTDRIMSAIRAADGAGISRTGINDALGGHVSKLEIDELIGDLVRQGQVNEVWEPTPKGGKARMYLLGPGAKR